MSRRYANLVWSGFLRITNLPAQNTLLTPPTIMTSTLNPSTPHSSYPGRNGHSQTENTLSEVLSGIDALKSTLENSRSPLAAGLLQKLGKIEEFVETVDAQPFNKNSSQTEFRQLRSLVVSISQQLRQAKDPKTLFQVMVNETRTAMNAERVLLYTFDDSGIIAESVARGFTPTLRESLPLDTFGLDSQADYEQQSIVLIDNIATAGLTPYQLQIWERFQIQASLSLTVMLGDKLWGMLVVHQSRPQRWQESQVNLLCQLVLELTVNLQPLQFQSRLQQQQNSDRSLLRIINKIEESRNLVSVFQTTTNEVRALLQCDRVSIYRFNEDWSGEFIAESVSAGWSSLVQKEAQVTVDTTANDRCTVKNLTATVTDTDTYLKETKGGSYTRGESFKQVNDIYQMDFSTCYIKSLERYQCRAYIIVPIFLEGKLWGLLAAYQNSAPRQWQDTEINLLQCLTAPLGVALQKAEYIEQVEAKSVQLAAFAQQEKFISSIVGKIRQSLEVNSIFRTATQELRQLLQCDRVGIYRFNEDWSGEFIAESVGAGWLAIIQAQQEDGFRVDATSSDRCTVKSLTAATTADKDTYLQDTKGGGYARGELYKRVDDIYQMGFSPCYIETLEKYQCRAYIIVPLFQNDKLWGLLAAYQNSAPRVWQDNEVEVLVQLSTPLSVAIGQAQSLQMIQQQSDRLTRTVTREQAIARITTRLSRTMDIEAVFIATPQAKQTLGASRIETIYKIATQQTRLMFSCSRVALYQFNPDWSGKFVAESAISGWSRLLDILPVIEDSYLQDTQGGRYKDQQSIVVNDIYSAGHADCHIELLEQMEARAYMIVPVFVGDKLWGLLGVYQNDAPREWEKGELSCLIQVGIQVGISLNQVKYLEDVRQQSDRLAKFVEREANFVQLIFKIGQRIVERLQQKNLNPDSLFRSVTQELRQLLNADRVAIYRFHPDWSGEFIIEDVGNGYLKLAGTDAAIVTDPVLQESVGGQYRKNQASAVNEVAATNDLTFSREILESWGAKAYIAAPLFKGEQQLWGLLLTYQNSHPRQWEDGEVNLLVQVATQLGIVLQQSEYLEQLQVQSQQLTEAARREKQANAALQHEVAQLLSAVQPALKGDLTVRAPVTEDEVGKIADTYNNTLENLRQLVMQVQEASQKVAETGHDSEASIVELANQAQQQFQALTQALAQIRAMVASTEAVATNAEQVEVAVQQANHTVQQGETAMNRTVDGILAIRDTVAETSKRIKRLSESSQKVSRVVNLISNFTTQTQILALNAAIEATKAGENGRGFAVVADEVRSLARQSGEATAEIEELVQEIQAGTAEVAAAMDTGIDQVVEGTNLVTEVRHNLNAIVAATTQISQLVERITQATQVQNQQSQSVTQTMNEVATIANKTSADSIQISASFKALLTMAQNLQQSASQFKVEKTKP
jgi:methyl-accepting chemotaxis protein PixJ